MHAVLLVARAELRRRWVSLLLIGLIAGITGGTAASAAGLARRTSTADERLTVATNADDVRTLIFGGERKATLAIGQEVLDLPEVRNGRIAPRRRSPARWRHHLLPQRDGRPGAVG